MRHSAWSSMRRKGSRSVEAGTGERRRLDDEWVGTTGLDFALPSGVPEAISQCGGVGVFFGWSIQIMTLVAIVFQWVSNATIEKCKFERRRTEARRHLLRLHHHSLIHVKVGEVWAK